MTADPSRQLSAAFPPPPPYFRNYTNENVAAAAAAAGQPTDVDAMQAAPSDVPNLAPPSPINEPIVVFGSLLDVRVNAGIPSLESLGIQPLYNKDLGVQDRASELKKLNHSLIYNFLELLELLMTQPENSQYKIEHIRLLFINFHHLLNEYRPHQARDTLAVMMQDQIRRRRETTLAIRNEIARARAIVASAGDL